MSCGFCYIKQGVLLKSPCFEMFIPEDIVFNTICKWFTNMDIIDKAALVKGYKIVMIWQYIKILPKILFLGCKRVKYRLLTFVNIIC